MRLFAQTVTRPINLPRSCLPSRMIKALGLCQTVERRNLRFSMVSQKIRRYRRNWLRHLKQRWTGPELRPCKTPCRLSFLGMIGPLNTSSFHLDLDLLYKTMFPFTRHKIIYRIHSWRLEPVSQIYNHAAFQLQALSSIYAGRYCIFLLWN